MNRLARLLAVLLVGAWTAAVVALLLVGAWTAADDADAHIPPATHSGDGSVQVDRMPWLDGASRELTQGWNNTHFSHHGNLYYGTDWGNHGVAYEVYAVAEGDAVCVEGDFSWGNYVRVDRSDGPLFDRYAHLDECPWSSSHLEQGDLIGPAGCSGDCTGLHLHYQKEDSAGVSVQYSLSNWPDFTDSMYGDPTPTPPSPECLASECHAFVSDNAGPGVGATASEATKIRNTYVFLGHLFPSPCGNAWDCFGSSSTVFGDGRPAAHDCVGPQGEPADCGWNQDFRDPRGALHNFNLADACGNNVHWVPGDIFERWLQNTDLGQSRGPVIQWSGTYYQSFRYGVLSTRTLTSPRFGGFVEVTMTVNEPNGCYP